MSVIASSWIGLGNAYQALGLRFGQEQKKRLQIKQELDQHEIVQSHLAKQHLPRPQGLVNESPRMSRRHGNVPHSGRAIVKK